MAGGPGILRFMAEKPNPSGNDELRGLVDARRREIEALARRYRITNIRLFGSVARGDSGTGSDVDFLVDPPEDATLFELASFRRELEGLLGVGVDIVSSRALLPRDRDVLDDAVAL